MANEIKKEAILKLEDEPYLKPISDTGVGFYNLDINTAVLTFQISKSGSPLLISEENAHSYAYFKSDNGSVSGVLDLEYKDSLNGIVTITLPTDFLQASSGSKVTGQIYITVNKWTNTPNNKSDTAVLSEFTFTVKDALINSVSGETKIEYIRMFDALKQQIQKRVHDIEEAIANGEDYVTEMKMTLESGKKELNDTVDRSKTSVQTTAEQAINDVNTTRDNTINKITNLSEETSSYVKNTADTAIQNVTGSSNEAIEHVDTKLEEFDQTIIDNGFVTPEVFNEEVESLEWQKYKLTNEDGTLKTLNVNNKLDELHALKPGQYYLSGVSGLPEGTSQIGIADMSWRQDGNIKCITYIPYNSNIQFIKRFNNTWSNWEQMNCKPIDTGWLPITWVNGAQQSITTEFTSSYRVLNENGIKQVYLRLSATNITNAEAFARIPSEITGGVDHYDTAATTIAKIPPKILVSSDGTITSFKYTNDTWASNSYLIIEMNWII
ncbi:BppU family phage baseplate upper protein [Staphylococcus cohnii]|uniref:BppU family phage baseplate upper protein n=1 Tax=Staphylococcus cohnii TaxID=29382 RepID=UPI0011A9DEBA|nr:BppU family phage baseplate upper protein [Staphylococcus cohnii]